MSEDLRDTVLSTIEASLEAQLRAIRRLRNQPEEAQSTQQRKSMSQVDMAFDILTRARAPLHEMCIRDRHSCHCQGHNIRLYATWSLCHLQKDRRLF